MGLLQSSSNHTAYMHTCIRKAFRATVRPHASFLVITLAYCRSRCLRRSFTLVLARKAQEERDLWMLWNNPTDAQSNANTNLPRSSSMEDGQWGGRGEATRVAEDAGVCDAHNVISPDATFRRWMLLPVFACLVQ